MLTWWLSIDPVHEAALSEPLRQLAVDLTMTMPAIRPSPADVEFADLGQLSSPSDEGETALECACTVLQRLESEHDLVNFAKLGWRASAVTTSHKVCGDRYAEFVGQLREMFEDDQTVCDVIQKVSEMTETQLFTGKRRYSFRNICPFRNRCHPPWMAAGVIAYDRQF